jgi:MFS transporter, YNFM family, putative membrane transport protein
MSSHSGPLQKDKSRKAIITLFVGTVTVISDIYVAQPILPLLSKDFNVSHATASLSVSLNILALSLALLVYGPLSDRIGRKPVMVSTGFLLSIPTALIAFTHDFNVFLLLRVIQGLLVAGIAAIAMAYIAEEFPPAIVGRVMGIYVGSMITAGFFGRVSSGVIAGLFSWRVTFFCFSLMNLAGAWSMHRYLPPSSRFRSSISFRESYAGLLGHLRNRRIVGACSLGFLLFFTFMGIFTYITFHLSAPPFSLSTTALGLIFFVYIGGIASPIAGSLSGRLGRRKVIAIGLSTSTTGILLTLSGSLPVIIVGMLLLCAGLFTTQPASSALVGDNAKTAKGSATSLYLFFYYIGGSLGSILPGYFWHTFGWPGVVGSCMVALAGACASLIVLCR